MATLAPSSTPTHRISSRNQPSAKVKASLVKTSRLALEYRMVMKFKFSAYRSFESCRLCCLFFQTSDNLIFFQKLFHLASVNRSLLNRRHFFRFILPNQLHVQIRKVGQIRYWLRLDLRIRNQDNNLNKLGLKISSISFAQVDYGSSVATFEDSRRISNPTQNEDNFSIIRRLTVQPAYGDRCRWIPAVSITKKNNTEDVPTEKKMPLIFFSEKSRIRVFGRPPVRLYLVFCTVLLKMQSIHLRFKT